MDETTIALYIIAGLLISFMLVMISNGYKNRKVLKAVQYFQYFWFLLTILAVFLTIINHLYNLKLWEVLQ